MEDLTLSNGLSVDELHNIILSGESTEVTAGSLEKAARWLIAGSQKPWLALEFGQRTNFQQLNIFGSLLASCGTVRESFELFSQYQSLLHPLFDLAFSIEGSDLCLRYSMLGNLPESPIYAEAILGAIPIWGARLTGEPLKPRAVWFRHTRPAYFEKYTEHFNCEVYFEKAFDAIWVDAGLLDAPILSASPAFHSKIKSQAMTQRQSMGTFKMEVKRILRASLPEDANIEVVAKALCCTERTLQRKLAEENAQFKQLKQEVKQEEAIRLLEETPLSIEQIAFQVGYEQRNSFVSAFQRWTGKSPAKWPR